MITIKYSHYWPPLGGINTSNPENPELARTARGDKWQDWVDKGIACPMEWKFGTTIKAFGHSWKCVDRGGMIVGNWVDFLEEKASLPYGTEIQVEIYRR